MHFLDDETKAIFKRLETELGGYEIVLTDRSGRRNHRKDILDIKVLDHVILGHRRPGHADFFVSLRESGLVEFGDY